MPPTRIQLGVITGAHGVRGAVRIRSFAQNPEDIAAYGPLSDATGNRQFSLKITGEAGGALLAQVDGVATREAAELLRNTALYIDRARLPEAEKGQYYHADLLGLRVVLTDGGAYGVITAVYNFGAGDLLEIQNNTTQKKELYRFTDENFPNVNIAVGLLTFIPPEVVE